MLGFLAGPPLFTLLDIDAASAASLRGTAADDNVDRSTADILELARRPRSRRIRSRPPPTARCSADHLRGAVRRGAGAHARELRTSAGSFFRGIADAMLVIVGWVLAAAPIGVFALAVTLAVRVGVGVAGAVGFYLAVHSGLLVVAGLLLYVVVRVAAASRLTFRARDAAGAARRRQHSLIRRIASRDDRGAERVLHLPTQVMSFALPFGVSIFRLNQGVSWIVAALFIGKLYGIHLTVGQLALLAAASVAMSFSVPGIPSGGLFVIAPFFMTVGLPIEGIGILIALDVIPDLFKTLLNVTGHMTATVLLSRNYAPPEP